MTKTGVPFFQFESRQPKADSPMINRPWQVWLAFAGCALVTLAAMGWLTLHTLRVDRQLTAARAEAEFEQQVDLALWRMDTKLAPLIAGEVAKPPTFYQDFYEGSESEQRDLVGDLARVMANLPANVQLNFASDTEGNWLSPQVPDSALEPLVLRKGLSPEELSIRKDRLQELSRRVDVANFLEGLPEELLPGVGQHAFAEEDGSYFAANRAAVVKSEQPAQGKAAKGLQDRGKRYQDVAQQQVRMRQTAEPEIPKDSGGGRLSEGISRPIWIGDALLLARRVEFGGKTYVQGSWLDWDSIKKELMSEAADIGIEVDLVPVRNVAETNPGRMLAGLPVQLVATSASSLAGALSPIRWALRFGWGALLLAAAAVAALLAGVIALSERRAAFVSSVTHELRSPLTTFRMYSDMLARGMVPDAQRRQIYLETLRREAERLTHLVENVLSYARLERGRGLNSLERVAVASLVERLQPRLAERAEQAEMQLEATVAENVAQSELQTDVSVVEQILFNLVDNAAKYAAEAEDSRIHWSVSEVGNCVRFVVSDHGPGFASTRKPQAFSKTSEEAAVTAPGVGLGLALCRRLAKQLGGKLEISANSDSASVTLDLPKADDRG